MVQTVDYFTPIVDDPYAFGQIAAANALSDIYAMGGKPLTVMNIVGFPISKLDKSILAAILEGGADKVREAGATLVGGHSIDDVDPKFGMAVTGLVDPRKVWTNANAKAGDALILTKPIGMGITTKAIKEGVAGEEVIAQVTYWMAMLNRQAAEIAKAYTVHAATDVTGFGLVGHALEMAKGSSLRLTIAAHQVPILPMTAEFAKQGLVPAGSRRNAAFVAQATTYATGLDPIMPTLLTDAVTSGGLLLSVPEEQAASLVAELAQAGMTQSAVIGYFDDGESGTILVDR